MVIERFQGLEEEGLVHILGIVEGSFDTTAFAATRKPVVGLEGLLSIGKGLRGRDIGPCNFVSLGNGSVGVDHHAVALTKDADRIGLTGMIQNSRHREQSQNAVVLFVSADCITVVIAAAASPRSNVLLHLFVIVKVWPKGIPSDNAPQHTLWNRVDREIHNFLLVLGRASIPQQHKGNWRLDREWRRACVPPAPVRPCLVTSRRHYVSNDHRPRAGTRTRRPAAPTDTRRGKCLAWPPTLAPAPPY
eukprot:scaffold88302_cov55-Attheya_sp.AAC.2